MLYLIILQINIKMPTIDQIFQIVQMLIKPKEYESKIYSLKGDSNPNDDRALGNAELRVLVRTFFSWDA